METYTIIIIVFGVIALILLSTLFFINRLSLLRNNIENSFAEINPYIEEIINMINELMIWIKNNLEYENEVLKTLTKEQEKLKNISNAKEGIEILKNNNRIEKAFENLEKTYEKINKNKEYLSLKERYIDSQNKINYTLDSYDKEVTTYNNYKEKKIIITLSKIFHFPNYNYYKK